MSPPHLERGSRRRARRRPHSGGGSSLENHRLGGFERGRTLKSVGGGDSHRGVMSRLPAIRTSLSRSLPAGDRRRRTKDRAPHSLAEQTRTELDVPKLRKRLREMRKELGLQATRPAIQR